MDWLREYNWTKCNIESTPILMDQSEEDKIKKNFESYLGRTEDMKIPRLETTRTGTPTQKKNSKPDPYRTIYKAISNRNYF